MKKITPFAVLATTTILGACGGSNSSEEMTTGPLFAVNGAGETVNLVQAASDGYTFTASGTETAGVRTTYQNGENPRSTAPADPEITLRLTSDGGLVGSIDGVETTFTAADADGDDGFEQEVPGESYIGVFGQSDSLAELIENGLFYSGAVSYNSFPDNAPGATTAYAVIGARTPVNVNPTGGAQYNGNFKAEVLPAEGGSGFTATRTRLRGDVQLNVDLAGSISGRLDDVTVQVPNSNLRLGVDGEIALGTSTVTDGAYSGSLTADAAFLGATRYTNTDLGTYAGRFYGPTANEATGTLTMRLDTSDGPENGYGYFQSNIEN